MNLKQTIRRILREETNTATLDTKVISVLNKEIIEHINKINSDIPKSKVSLVDRNKIMSELKTYFTSISPQVLSNMKMGKGGDTFVYGVYKKLNEIIDRELNDMNWVKKQTIKVLAPSEKETREILSSNFDDYYHYFDDNTDFTFWIGAMDETQPYRDNIWKFYDQRTMWLKTNRNKIKNEFVNKMINFLYK